MNNNSPSEEDSKVFTGKPFKIENVQEHYNLLRQTSIAQSAQYLGHYLKSFQEMLQLIQSVSVVQNAELAMLREIEQHLRQETLTVEIATDILSRIEKFRAAQLERIAAQIEAAKQQQEKK